MPQPIRFRVHEEPYSDLVLQPEWYDQFQNIDNTADALFAIMNMMNVLEPIFSVIDPLQIVMQNSENDLQLRRHDNVNLNINSQFYHTTDKKYDTCSICTDNYEKNDIVSVLGCGHIYHPNCIKEWGKYKPNCPVCNSEISTQSVIDETD